MGRVKEVLVELDNGAEAVVTRLGISIVTESESLMLTTNDLEQTMSVIRYLREVRPFETLAEITGEHAQMDWGTSVLPTLPNAPVVGGAKRK